MRVLIDTSALLALAHGRDQHHDRAVAFVRRHREAGGTFVGTSLILSEFYSHLLYLRGAAAARAALEQLLGDPIHDWWAVDVALIQGASQNWLARYSDQAFSLADAVSFEAMRRNRVTHAFAFDRHFAVAGFELPA